MLLDDSVHVVIHVGTHHQSVLCLALHGLGIDVVVVLLVLDEPSLFLELAEVLGGFLVDARVIFAGSLGEINLGFDDMVEALLVVAGFLACLFRVEHVIGARFHLLDELFRWADASEWFDCCHGSIGMSGYLFTWNLVQPSLKKALICLAAAMPALVLASAVWAPIFLGVLK